MSENLSHAADCEGDAVNLELVQEIFGNICVNCASFVAKNAQYKTNKLVQYYSICSWPQVRKLIFFETTWRLAFRTFWLQGLDKYEFLTTFLIHFKAERWWEEKKLLARIFFDELQNSHIN